MKQELYEIRETLISPQGNGDSFQVAIYFDLEKAKQVLDEIEQNLIEESRDLTQTWSGIIKNRGYSYDSTMNKSTVEYSIWEVITEDDEVVDAIDTENGFTFDINDFDRIQDEIIE